MYESPIMFVSRSLEERFRRFLVPFKAEEVGGFFFVDYTMPKGVDWRKTKAQGFTLPNVIRSWMMLPNESAKKQSSWGAWDFEKAHEAATTTAKSLGLFTLHFHSHPLGSTNEPSGADLLFWTKWCDGEGVIVTNSPLRLTPYFILPRHAGLTSEIEQAQGDFYSWRTAYFRQLKVEG